MILFAAILAGCGTSDPHREVVEKRLSDNLNDPEYEVVRWWPAKEVPEYKEARVKQWDRLAKESQKIVDDLRRLGDKSRITTASDARAMRDKAAAEPPPTMARMKYRAKNAMGAKILADQLFVFDKDGKIEGVIDAEDPDDVNQAIWGIRDRIFPE